ncbi:LuxR family transcriptional regulator [Streptomyces sp. TRM64462]|uniref:helix-turn-helix transcriptional regulator n=1 Tax=Streptomyces sp. TRM64462 TaxID=2741726 RepID=UPI0020C76D1D|nr:LuxR family transcriptional regulator [Streptomyces sp. TRM64462]
MARASAGGHRPRPGAPTVWRAGTDTRAVSRALLSALCDATRVAPVAVVIDDAQWIDPESAAALGVVLNRLDRCRFLLIVVVRTPPAGPPSARPAPAAVPAPLAGFVGVPDRVDHLRLGRLTVDETRALVEAGGAGLAGAALADCLHRRTGGHPLHTGLLLSSTPIEELLTRGGSCSVPPAFSDTIRARIGELPADSRRIVEALAVVDSWQPLGLVARLAGVEVRDGGREQALEPLIGAGLVKHRESTSGEGLPALLVRIHHELERDVIYRAIPPRRRRELHASAAPAMSGHAAWRHRVAAADGFSDSLATALEAEARAVAEHDLTHASAYLLWAAGLTEDPAERERLTLTVVMSLLQGFDVRRARRLKKTVAAFPPSPLRSLVLGQFALLEGDAATAAHDLSSALEALEAPEQVSGESRPGSARLAGVLRAFLAAAELALCRETRAVALARRALAGGRLDGPLAGAATILHYAALIEAEGPVEALRAWERAERPPDEPERHRPYGRMVLISRGLLRLAAGRPSRALGDLESGLHSPDGLLSPVGTIEASRPLLAFCRYLLGDWDAAESEAEQALASALIHDCRGAVVCAHSISAVVASGRGHAARADAHVREARRLSRTPDGVMRFGFTSLAAATVAHAQADHAGVLHALRPLFGASGTGPVPEAQEAEEALGHTSTERTWCLPLYVEACLALGRDADAEPALAELVGVAEELPALRVPAGWLSARLAEASGDLSSSLATYEELLGSGYAAEDDLPLYLACAEQGAARVHHALGRSATAVAMAARARSRYESLGARPYAERCAEALADWSERPPGRQAKSDAPGAGAGRFTARERQVAQLVGQALTNGEIAAELDVTVKTVEYHLGNIYTKLGIRSRHELRRIVTGI